MRTTIIKGDRAAQYYVDEFLAQSHEWKKAKLILIGHGDIGKTTLLRNLSKLDSFFEVCGA